MAYLQKKMNLMVFSGDYDKALAALILANEAREIEMEASLFFAFWGLLLIRDPERAPTEDKNMLEKTFGAMTPKSIDELPLSKMNYAGLGKAMLQEMMEEKEIPPLSAFLKGAIHKGVRLYACRLSLQVMGFHQEELLPQVEVMEAKAYLQDACQSDLQLFI